MKYAYYNGAAQDAPVLAWIDATDTDTQLPTIGHLIALSDAQWTARGAGYMVTGGQLVPVPGITVPQAQAAKLAQIELDFQTVVQVQVAYMGTTFQADKGSRELMNDAIAWLDAIVAIGGVVPLNFAWWDSNNVAVPMTLTQIKTLFVNAGMAFNASFVHKQSKKSAIRQAATVPAIESINW